MIEAMTTNECPSVSMPHPKRMRTTDRNNDSCRPHHHQTDSEAHAVTSNLFVTDELWAEIFQFVGGKQFLFMATTSRRFRRIYTESFPDQTTTYNITTNEHARICFDTGRIPQNHLRGLWRTALRHDMLYVLYHLFYVYTFYDRSSQSTKIAAECGHVRALQWLVSIGSTLCLKYSGISAIAAKNGHINILQFIYSSTTKSTRPWNTSTCYSAASREQWSTLHWLIEHECQWCDRTMSLLRHHRYQTFIPTVDEIRPREYHHHLLLSSIFLLCLTTGSNEQLLLTSHSTASFAAVQNDDHSICLDDMSCSTLISILTFDEAADVGTYGRLDHDDTIGTDVSGGAGKSTFVGSEIVEIDLSDFDASLLDILLQDDE